MFLNKEITLLKKSDKQEVDVTVCYYNLDDDKDRYVFYFYDPTERKPIYKWAYYLIDNNLKDLRKKYHELLKEKKFKPNKIGRLCMCNNTTRINTIKLPKTLKYALKYKSLIMSDLKEKMGNDVKSYYYINNELEGADEKKAESIEKKILNISGKRKSKIDKFKNKIKKQEYEYYFEEPKINERNKVFNKLNLSSVFFFLVIQIFLLLAQKAGLIDLILLFEFETFTLAYFTYIIYAQLRNRKPREGIKKKRLITYKNILDAYYCVLFGLLIFLSEFVVYYLITSKIPDQLLIAYEGFIVIAILSIFIIEHLKRVNLSGLCKVIEFKKRNRASKTYYVGEEIDEDDEELFENGMNENKIFNMSRTKVKITKSKKARGIVTFRQLLVPKTAYKSASKVCAILKINVGSFRTLPSLIASFHRKHSKGVNEIVVYNEAGFTLLVGFVNDSIVDSFFIEGNERKKDKEGNQFGLQLSTFKNVFSSLLWECQKQTSNMDRVVFITNGEQMISKFKKENTFGLPSEIVADTGIIFGESVRKVKTMTMLKAFTLIETVVAIALFAITVSLTLSVSYAINNFNIYSSDLSKTNIYVNNIREVLTIREDGYSVENTVKNITKYELGSNNKIDGTYYLKGDLNIYSPSKIKNNQTYCVNFALVKNEFMDNQSYIQDFSKYVFTIKSISRISTNKEIMKNISIEIIEVKDNEKN